MIFYSLKVIIGYLILGLVNVPNSGKTSDDSALVRMLKNTIMVWSEHRVISYRLRFRKLRGKIWFVLVIVHMKRYKNIPSVFYCGRFFYVSDFAFGVHVIKCHHAIVVANIAAIISIQTVIYKYTLTCDPFGVNATTG